MCLESLYEINHISPMKNLRNSLKFRNFVVLNNLYLAQHSTAQHSTAQHSTAQHSQLYHYLSNTLVLFCP